MPEITVGSIVTIGKAKTLWEVAGRTQSLLNLIKVDGDGYVSYSKRPDEVTYQCGPCQEITLAQLIEAKHQAREAALKLAERLRLWPEEDDAWAAARAATRLLEAWTAARDLHYAGRRAGNIEAAIRARRAAEGRAA